MVYAEQLKPTVLERIELPSGSVAKIPKAEPVFKLWKGRKVTETYGGKAVLSF